MGHIDDDNNDSDSEFTTPSYDELVYLLKEYIQFIRNTKTKNKKHENISLLAKYDLAKTSDELKYGYKNMP
jgi:hypothetical protein